MKIKDLKKLLVNSVKDYISPEEADYFAAEVIETDIRKPPQKKYSQGLIDDIQAWKKLKDQKMLKTIDLPRFTKYDFRGWALL